MKISSVEFVKSAVKTKDLPPELRGEIAFAGRSNVGKSSLINTLVNRKKLAKISSTPGRTRTINYFVINNEFYFVDLPGYGYAKVSKSMRKSWRPMVDNYLKSNRLDGLILIIDIRRDPGEEELNFKMWLDKNKIPVVFVLTKCDKISRSKRFSRIKEITGKLNVTKSDVLVFSAVSKEGKEELWQRLTSLIFTETTGEKG